MQSDVEIAIFDDYCMVWSYLVYRIGIFSSPSIMVGVVNVLPRLKEGMDDLHLGSFLPPKVVGFIFQSHFPSFISSVPL